MHRKRIIWLLIAMFVVQATFPYFLNERAEAASSTHLGGKEVSFKHLEDDTGNWATYENGNVMQIDGYFIRADVNQLRAKWQQTLGKDVKLGGIGFDSPTAYTPPKGYKIHSYSSYAVYQMRTYLVQKDNSSCDGGLPVENKCHPYYFDGVAGEDNRWAKRPNIKAASDWVNYQPNMTRYNPGLKKDMLYYQWRTAQIRKKGDTNGHLGTPWLKYDFKIVPIAQTPVPDPEKPEPEPDPEEPEPEPEPEPIPNIPPRVTIDGPTIVMAGEEFCANAYGEDDDGYVDAYLWTPVQSERAGDVLCTSYPNTGNQSITVVAIDNEGAVSIPATHIITVIAPQPSADFSVQGALKENRKVQLRTVHPYGERKGVIEAFPMVEEKWSITAMNAANQEYIKTHFNLAENISYDKVIDVLMKVKGDYKVRRHVKNSLGLEDTVEKIITIQPDYLPLADFDVVTKTFRDNILLKPGQSTATIKITDKSYSNDDYIKQRIWSYYYDSDNDGSYLDETEIIASKENETSMNIKNLEKVGKYLIQLKVIEEFGQETIDDFVTSEDRRRHEVTIAQTELSIPSKPLSERTVMIDNLAPNATYSVRLKGSTEDTEMDKTIVDVQIGLDKTNYSPAVVESAMTTVKTRLNAENIQSNITVKEIKKPYKIVDGAPTLAPYKYTSYNSILLALDSGDVYVAGTNYADSFGLDDAGTKVYSTFTPLKRTWQQENITSLLTTGWYGLLLSNTGNVYTMGYDTNNGAVNALNPNGPKVNERAYSGAYSILPNHENTFGTNKASSIEVGVNGHFILLNNGIAYAYGSESNGEFSDGYNAGSQGWVYNKVNGAWGTTKLKQISSSARSSFTLFLDVNGKAYTSGMGENYQGGGSSTGTTHNAVAVNAPWGALKVVKVQAGSGMSYFLLENGDVYKVGRDHLGNVLRTPTLVQKSWGTERIVDIGYSGYYTGHFVTESGNVYSEGINTIGTFGNGSATTTSTSIPVKMTKTWGNQKIAKIKGGQFNLVIITEKGEAHLLGRNTDYQLGNGTASDTPKPYPVRANEPWNEGRGESPWSASDSDMAFGVLFGQEEFEEIDSITNEMLEHNLDFFGVGTAKNLTQMNEIITRNLNRGKTVNDVNNLETTANELADYIIEKINKKKTEKEIYLVLEESAEYLVNYRDEENDDKLSEIWKFDHTPQEFENDMGIDFRHMKELVSPIERFAKVGLYKPILRAKDEPIFWGDNRFNEYRKWSSEYDEWSIYVHRKPIPNFTFKIGVDRSYSITNQAYDLDKYSVNIGKGPGIRTQKWEWRLLNTTNWNQGLPPSPLDHAIYEVRNTVVDFQNREESIIKIMNATGVNVPPIPLFDLLDQVEEKETFSPIDFSYDPNGDDITEWRWSIKKLGDGDTNPTQDAGFSQFSTSSTPSLSLEKGVYIIRLQVKDEFGLWSADPSKYAYETIEVLSPNEPPVAGFKVADTYVGSPLNVISEAIDPDGDTLEYSYNVTTPKGNTFVVASGKTVSDKKGFPIIVDELGNVQLETYDVEDVGTWTFTQVVTDPDGESATFGPITAEVLPLIITGNVYHTEEWSRIHLTKGNAPNEFYSGEKFLLAAQVSDYPIKTTNVSISGTLENGESFLADVSLNKESSIRYIGDYFEERFSNPGTMIKEGSEVTFTFSVIYENEYQPENYIVNVLIIGNVYDYLNERYHRNYQ